MNMKTDNQPKRIRSLLENMTGLALGAVLSTTTLADEPISFNRDIRPILSDNCFFCHGPDKNKLEADLRLDPLEGLHGTANKEGTQGNGTNGTSAKPGVIVPGKPEASLLVQRITSQNRDEHMPPVDSGKELSAAQIDLLKRWIAQGGQYEGHWSFLPRRNNLASGNEPGNAPVGAKTQSPLTDAQMTARIDARIQIGRAHV